jgi:hypothetical protein
VGGVVLDAAALHEELEVFAADLLGVFRDLQVRSLFLRFLTLITNVD